MSHTDDMPDTRPEETTGRTVVGLFRDRRRVEAVIQDLEAAGFSRDRVGLAMQSGVEQGDLLEDPGDAAAEGVAKGAVSGGLVGGVLGLLGSLVIPGIGPIVAGGLLASTLAGAGIGAAAGGVLGALIALGVPAEDASHFDTGLRAGGVLLTVDAGARTPEALAILGRHEVDLGPSGARRYDDLASPTRDHSTPAASPPVAYTGEERRLLADPAYAGPERRLVGA